MMISKKQSELSNAEKDYINEINKGEERVSKFGKAITNLKNKIKYQELQVFTITKHVIFQVLLFSNCQMRQI